MIVDFLGRVYNTPLSARQGLIPLFEAIVNSIHAIEEAKIKNGQINIVVKRNIAGLLITDNEQLRIAPIIGFEITDNGIGFNNENFESFCVSDTQKKRHIGGKGVGRFLWLKAFSQVNVKSVFRQNGKLMERSFGFVLDNDPIMNHQCDSTKKKDVVTNVLLQDLLPQFSEGIPRSLENIAYRIIEHCLEYFVLDRMPAITLSDDLDEVDLVPLYQEMVSNSEKSEFQIDGHKFVLFHFLLTAHTGMFHRLNYCAAHRVVDYDKLDNKDIPNLPAKIESMEKDSTLIYMGYLSSKFLDTHVNQQRTGFDVYSEGQIKYVGELSLNEIRENALSLIDLYLQPITRPVGEEKLKLVEDFVITEAPQYRSLLKYHPEAIDQIPPQISHEKLDLELYRAQKEWDVSLRETADEIINDPNTTISDDGNDIHSKYLTFLEEWNENGKAALAKYVVHRKITLAILERYMQSSDEHGYARERTIHQLIFPLKRTSDDVDYEQQNLWIIDERLAFQRYLASDLELRQVDVIESNELDRPDLLIFDNPIAMVEGEPINGVTIFEFKRPMRSDSNPVEQMYGYVRKIRAGKANTNHNRPIVVIDETPFYCYAVCDLPERLRHDLENMGMQRAPDNGGYFFYNPNLKAYVEVISYDKLLRDASQRNKILFEKLNITG